MKSSMSSNSSRYWAGSLKSFYDTSFYATSFRDESNTLWSLIDYILNLGSDYVIKIIRSLKSVEMLSFSDIILAILSFSTEILAYKYSWVFPLIG